MRREPSLSIERAIKMFTELHGDLPVAQIKRAMRASSERRCRMCQQAFPGNCATRRYRNSHNGDANTPTYQKITAATVNKQLTAVQAIANWARDNGMIPDDVQWADPFRRMRLG